MRTVVRFDRLLQEVHVEGDNAATVCGEPMPPDVPWIDWPQDGAPRCARCFGFAATEEAMF